MSLTHERDFAISSDMGDSPVTIADSRALVPPTGLIWSATRRGQVESVTDAGSYHSVRICLAESSDSPHIAGETIGQMALVPSGPPSSRCGRFSFGLAKPFHGKGYGREALEWLIEWGFNWPGLHRVRYGLSVINVWRKPSLTSDARRSRQAASLTMSPQPSFIHECESKSKLFY